MSKKAFTIEAELLWGRIPPADRERILENVFCGACLKGVQMADYSGTVQKGDVILKGNCSVCGGPVTRLVETSESKRPLS